jgi:hypothetical protein
MPIDFDALLAPFHTALHLQWRSIGESLRKLAKWVTERLKLTRDREIATRDFQTFLFNGSAVSTWIDPIQHGALGPRDAPPPEGILRNAAAPFQAFWRGLLLAPAMVESELAIPRMLGAVSDFLALLVASLDRFRKPEANQFDLRIKRRWDDLFGEIGLFFRLVNDAATVKQMQTFSDGGIALIKVIRKHFPPTPPAPGGAGGDLTELTRWTFGGTIVLPLAIQLLTHLATTAVEVVKLRVLDGVEAVMHDVFALRRAAIDFMFGSLMAIGSQALEWVVLTQTEVVASLRLYASFLGEYVDALQQWITNIGQELKPFADGLIQFLHVLGHYLDAFMGVNFGDAVTLGMFDFHLADILDWREHPEKAKELQDQITDYIKENHKKVWLGEKAFDLRSLLEALRTIIGIAATHTLFPAEATPPDLTDLQFPDLYKAFFEGPKADDLRKSLVATSATLSTGVAAVFDAGIKATRDLGDSLGEAAATAAQMGVGARYRQIASNADRLSETTFGARELRAKLGPPKDPVALAFESWLAGSAFQIIEKALPAYTRQMLQFWKTEAAKTPADRPTSPHIVARHAQVGRVKTPRLVIRVPEGHALDKSLAAEIGDRVRTGVAQAFGLGMAKAAAA